MLCHQIACALCLAISLTASAQTLERTVIGSAGETTGSSNIELDWTIGEAVIGHRATSTALATEGFHQTLLHVINSVEDGESCVIRIYPNPFRNQAFIEYTLPVKNYNLELFDAIGVFIFNQRLPGETGIATIDLTHFPSGTYLARLLSPEGIWKSTFKLIKTTK